MGPSARKWAVLIGINGYHESLGPLKFCANDAKLVRDTLVSETCGFAAKNVLLLSDDQPKDHLPTFGNVHSWLGTWLSRPSSDDLVLVYFAGHGRELQGSAFLAPVDATLESLPVTGIPIQYVRDLLERCKASQKVLILDACHSGAGRDVVTMPHTFREALDAGEGLYTIASCDSDQVSHDWSEKEHGVFTYYLAEAIRDAAPPDHEGAVTLDSVYDWTRRKVLDWTAEHRLKQEPVRICRVKGQIPIAIRPMAIEERLEQAQAEIARRDGELNEVRDAIEKLREEKSQLAQRVPAFREAKKAKPESIDADEKAHVRIVLFPPEVAVDFFLDDEPAEALVRETQIDPGRHKLAVVPRSMKWGVRRVNLRLKPSHEYRKVIRLRKVIHARTILAVLILFCYCVVSGAVFDPLVFASLVDADPSRQMGMQFLWAVITCGLVSCHTCFVR